MTMMMALDGVAPVATMTDLAAGLVVVVEAGEVVLGVLR